jgi:hypothetical protein
MLLTPTLLASLNRVWKRDPNAKPALRISYPGSVMVWSIADLVFTTRVNGENSLSLNLADYTVQELALYIAAQPGYQVTFISPTFVELSAMVLLDGGGDQSVSIQGFTRLSWAFLDAIAEQLTYAQSAAALAPLMMVVGTAQFYWLDKLGAILGACTRISGEPDDLYGPRMISSLIAPKFNNVAIEIALESVYGFENVSVTDVVVYSAENTYNGAFNFDGSKTFNASAVAQYGLFDISGTYAGPYPSDQVAPYLSAFLASLRAGGCHPRNINLVDTSGNMLAITRS